MAQAIDDYCAYYVRTTNLPKVLSLIEKAMNCDEFAIRGGEYDRTATIKYDGIDYRLPIFATLRAGDDNTYSQEENQVINLSIGDRDVKIESGMFAPTSGTSTRTGAIGSIEEELMHTRVWFDVDPQFVCITLDFLSQQRCEDTEQSPRYKTLHGLLVENCEYCIVCYEHTGIKWAHPPLPDEYLPDEHWLEGADEAVEELVEHHSNLPTEFLREWPVSEFSKTDD